MIVEVEGESGLGTARAWAYVYARAVADMPWIKSGDWLDG